MARETADGCDEEVERVVRIAQSHSLFKPSRLERWLRYKQSKSEILEKMANVKGVVFFANKNQLLEREMAAWLLWHEFHSGYESSAAGWKKQTRSWKLICDTIWKIVRNWCLVVTTTKTRMKKKKVIDLKKTDFRNGAWWYMIQWTRKQVMENIRDSSSITYRTTNTWRVRYSCTSLPENPIKVGVAIPSTKPTIYSLVSPS